MLSFTSVKIITSWIILALTHPECVYTAEFHLSAGDFDLKITLGFEISKSTVRSRLIHISLPEEVGVGPLSRSAGGILLSNARPSMLTNHFLPTLRLSGRLLLLDNVPRKHADCQAVFLAACSHNVCGGWWLMVWCS